jgi:glycosyltransferase involved in cell wall biosynthesis
MLKELKLTVIIPVYNEVNTIEYIVNRVREKECVYEIVVVDDCSTDGTEKILSNLRKKVNHLIIHERNLGKGAAIRTALKYVTGDVIVIQDADLEYNPDEYPILLEPILEGKADVVYGSRFTGKGPHRVLFFWHYVGNKLLTLLSNMLTNLTLTDMETGYKAFKSEVIKDITIKQNRFGFEPEITAKIAKKRLRFYEVGISYAGRTYDEGKKVGWKDGFVALWCILKYNLL